MKNRLIIVPKNKEAEKDLDFDKAKKSQLIELHLNDEEFILLYKKGVFELINEIGSTSIDDYEDASLIGEENISNVMAALKLKNVLFEDDLIMKIICLFEAALNNKTGVYFYF
jgi:hypothetical protein